MFNLSNRRKFLVVFFVLLGLFTALFPTVMLTVPDEARTTGCVYLIELFGSGVSILNVYVETVNVNIFLGFMLLAIMLALPLLSCINNKVVKIVVFVLSLAFLALVAYIGNGVFSLAAIIAKRSEVINFIGTISLLIYVCLFTIYSFFILIDN